MGCSLYKLRLMGVQEDIRRVINCTIRSLVLALPPWYVSYYRFKNPILQMCPNLNLCQERLMGNDQDRLGPTVSIMVNGFWWKDHIYHSLAVLPLIKRSPKRMFGSQNTSLPRVSLWNKVWKDWNVSSCSLHKKVLQPKLTISNPDNLIVMLTPFWCDPGSWCFYWQSSSWGQEVSWL